MLDLESQDEVTLRHMEQGVSLQDNKGQIGMRSLVTTRIFAGE